MDFWVDMGFAVLLRLLRDRRERERFRAAFRKVHDAIEIAFPAFTTEARAGKSEQGGTD